MDLKKKVFVGLSGGVDSAVSALLLKKAGYDVTGVFIKVWQPDFLTCTWREERREAMRVAGKLGIPFLFFDFEDEYKKGVAEYMIEEYRNGRTPNPDVMCNKEIKFGVFLKKAKEMGADFVATGHYARVEKNKKGKFVFKEGVEKDKDQSYFLWMLRQEDLANVLFPVGNLKKEEVRELAKKFKLPNARKKDSQGICFLGDVDLEDFLSRFIKTGVGEVLDTEGKVIGRHRGALYYTIGERHGFEVEKKKPDSKAYFVVSKDVEKNTITVSNNDLEIESILPKSVTIEKENWINQPKGKSMEARLRYRQEKVEVELTNNLVHFEKSQIIAPGQSIVFYEGEECIGGGIIS